jgi:hypothetical protein
MLSGVRSPALRGAVSFVLFLNEGHLEFLRRSLTFRSFLIHSVLDVIHDCVVERCGWTSRRG